MLGLLNGCGTSRGLSGIRPVGDVAVGQTSVAAANLLVERGQYGLAIAAYRRVLRLDPASSLAREGLAISYELLGRADLADRYYQEALALAPRSPRIYQNFAAFLRAQRRDADAAQLMADMRIALPGIELAVATAPVPTPPRVEPVPVAEPDVRLIRQSERATLVVTMPRQPAVPVAAPATTAAPVSALPRDLHPLRIVNAVGRYGVARQAAALLAKGGFAGAETGDAAFRLKRSRILVPRGSRELGEKLSRSLPFAVRIEQSARAGRVQLLIGADALPALMRARRA
jgi:tetratricopeptide (TPR) repeat protein